MNLDFTTVNSSGFNYKDRICLSTLDAINPKYCIDEFKFIGSLFPVGLPSGIDGVLGIGDVLGTVIGDSLSKKLIDS